MSLIVQKYGGTSVANPERIGMVADKIIKAREQGNQIVAVVSAMSGETNRLLKLASEVCATPNPREVDVLLSTGEQVTIALLCMALHTRGYKARSMTGSQVHILTDSVHNKARIKKIDGKRVHEALANDSIVVVAGFQGVDESGNITTLGRGGSDTSAVALAAALKADECQIYTDVKGVYTTDPRVVPEARLLDCITYEEMLEMASLGAKVLQIRSVEFAQKYNVKLRVASSFEECEGTLITEENESKVMEDVVISGIAFNKDEAKLTIQGVPDHPGIAHQILGPIADANIEVDMIIQNVGQDSTTDFTFTVHRNDYKQSMQVLQRVADQLGAREVHGDDDIVKVSLVGVGMRSHAGIANQMFQILAEKSINIQMISTSEIKVSVIIAEGSLKTAVTALHSGFGLTAQD